MNTSSSNMAYLMAHALQPSYEEDVFAGEAAFAATVGLNSADESLPYSTAELNAPEYSTDDFRMFSFKVARCSKRYVHDWRACPFAHPTENARRRDPRLHKYLPVPCPEYKRGICFRGDGCPYSHGVYECWLHPAKYRTQLCKEGPHCRRPVCFFAHSVLDLRQPTHVWDGNNYEPQTAAAALLQAASGAGPAPSASRSNSGSGPDSALLQMRQKQASAAAALAAEEALNNGGGSNGQLSSLGRSHSGGSTASGTGPPSPHGSSQGRGGGSGSPALRNSPSFPAGGTTSRDASPTTPARASCDIPARPSTEPVSAASALLAAPGAATGAVADLQAVTSAFAAALAQAQAQVAAKSQQQVQQHAHGGLPPRHSIDVGALAASTSRASSLTAPSAPPAPAQSPHQPRMSSFDLGSPQQAAGAPNGLPPRMSLDSLMPSRAAGAQSANWPPPPIPEVPNGNGPRMSNAVARKLGLAPQRTANEARLAKLRTSTGSQPGMATPPRTSLDGLLQALHSSRPSLEQQMVSQQMLAAAGLANGVGPINGGYMPAPYLPAGGYAPQPMPAGADPAAMGINPALLSVVAAQMGGAPMPAGACSPQAMPPPPNAAAMAALVDSLQGWNLNAAAQHGGYPMPHRAASFDGSMPPSHHHHHPAMMAPHQQGPPTSSPYYLPPELETMMNNHNGEGLVNPVGGGQGRGGRE